MRPIRGFHVPPAAIAALVAVFLVAGSSCRRPVRDLPERSNIILITIDALRADHLSCYGYARRTSPNLDRMAREGVRFHNPAVQWPKTAPSFASMFTSTYPKDNGVLRRVGDPIPGGFRTLAEMLRSRGYGTYAVVSNAALAAEYRFDQGFDVFTESWKLGKGRIIPNSAETVGRLAQGVLGKIDRSKPFFLWVHLLDPHTPYVPPPEWGGRFENDRHFDPTVKIEIARDKQKRFMTGIGRGQAIGKRDDLAFYVAQYDAEIAYADHHVGLLLKEARRQGLMRDTLTVVTADHGESLGDHQYFFDHGRFVFEDCVRVPLVFHYPGVLRPAVIDEPVELVHLAATLLEVAGVPLRDGTWMQGRSLLPDLRGEKRADSAAGLAFSQAGYSSLLNNCQRSMRDRRFKLVESRDGDDQIWIGGEGVQNVLYDLQDDPGELVNAASRYPAEFHRLRRALRERWTAPPFQAIVETGAEDSEPEVDGRTIDLLKSLGYI